ncbi:MAG: dockerin type I repeat-containing protein, partial [Oscillospiraceae bacterium]|nr:dockerin type I repeat-containing protein [Oscillospiraceae bacterium]
MKKKIFAWLLATMLCIPTALQGTAAEKPTGDINADWVLDIMDVILLQKWLFAVPETHIADPEAGDFDADGTLDVFDLALMKMALVDRPQEVLPPDEPTNIGFHSYEEYENFVYENELQGKMITYDQISDFGEFLTLAVNAKWETDRYFELSYTLNDGSGDTFLLLITDIDHVKPDQKTYERLSDQQINLSDMRHAETEAAYAYYEADGRRYNYTNGDLGQIVWQDETHEYMLVGTPKLSEYPDVKDTRMAGLLDLSALAPIAPPNITDEDYQNVYDRFKTDGYVYQITENEITLRTDRKSSILVRTAYEDMGI